MEIGIFGATGVIGQRILVEAGNRGHRVTAFTRHASRIPDHRGAVTWKVANVLDAASVASALAGLDVVVNAINAGHDVPDTMANADVLPAAARTLLKGLEQYPSVRLLVVGGAGSLEVEPGLQVVDMDGFADGLPEHLGVPPEYVKVVIAHREALNLYRLSNRNWTYLSPSAGMITPGERTGKFRVGGDQLLISDDGTSSISAEDLAMAIIDEVETPRYIQRRFTVGY